MAPGQSKVETLARHLDKCSVHPPATPKEQARKSPLNNTNTALSKPILKLETRVSWMKTNQRGTRRRSNRRSRRQTSQQSEPSPQLASVYASKLGFSLCSCLLMETLAEAKTSNNNTLGWEAYSFCPLDSHRALGAGVAGWDWRPKRQRHSKPSHKLQISVSLVNCCHTCYSRALI